jgi:hypothetical protein
MRDIGIYQSCISYKVIPSFEWAIYGPFLVNYFNTPSHLLRESTPSEVVKVGYEEYPLLKGKTFDDMVRWRDSMLIDLLRVLQYLPEHGVETLQN